MWCIPSFFLPPFTCLSDFPASSSYEAYLQRNIEMLADFRTLGGRRRRSDRVVDPWIRNILPVSWVNCLGIDVPTAPMPPRHKVPRCWNALDISSRLRPKRWECWEPRQFELLNWDLDVVRNGTGVGNDLRAQMIKCTTKYILYIYIYTYVCIYVYVYIHSYVYIYIINMYICI